MKLNGMWPAPKSTASVAPMTTLRLETFLPYQLSYTSELVSAAVASVYASLFGLTIPQWRVMAVVGEAHGSTQQQIVERTLMDKVAVSRAAVALTRRGVLARVQVEHDRRALALNFTPAGQALYDQIVPKALDLERRLFEGVDPAELAALTQTLDRLADRARALAADA